MAETVNVSVDDLRKLRDWWKGTGEHLGYADPLYRCAVARLVACIPWEPSEEDITAYCEAKGWNPAWSHDRGLAAAHLREVRERGWDIVPHRIKDQS